MRIIEWLFKLVIYTTCGVLGGVVGFWGSVWIVSHM